jgi:hypothetical protein
MLTLVAAAGITVISLLPRFSGIAAWILRIIAIFLATFGPIATQIEKRRMDESARLDVLLSSNQESITPFPFEEQSVEEWIAVEQADCLQSVDQFEGRALNLAPTPLPSELSNLLGRLLIQPELRTPEEYRNQVENHLHRARTVAWQRLKHDFVEAGFGVINLQLINNTDRPFQNVVVELLLPGDTDVFTKETQDEEPEKMPTRPHEFRTPTTSIYDLDSSLLSKRLLSLKPRGLPKFEPLIQIEPGDSVRVTFAGVRLSPTGTVKLSPLYLVTRRHPGSPFEMNWEATASNADGRVKGVMVLAIGAPLKPQADLIDRILKGSS